MMDDFFFIILDLKSLILIIFILFYCLIKWFFYEDLGFTFFFFFDRHSSFYLHLVYRRLYFYQCKVHSDMQNIFDYQIMVVIILKNSS